MPIAFRPALDSDFEYCKRLFLDEFQWIIEELRLDRAVHETAFQQKWVPAQVRIIVLDGADIGWVQTFVQNDEFFIAQMIVDHRFQGQGVGTEVMKRLIGEAGSSNLAVCLDVVKINPARRLYERLGFRITHEDNFKFYMRREPDMAARL